MANVIPAKAGIHKVLWMTEHLFTILLSSYDDNENVNVIMPHWLESADESKVWQSAIASKRPGANLSKSG